MSVIEQEIFKSLQANESAKVKQLSSSEVASMQSIRSRVPGNGFCVDCDAPSEYCVMVVERREKEIILRLILSFYEIDVDE